MAYLRLRLPQAETARPRLFQELLNPEFPGYRPKCVSVLACVPLWQWAFLLFELYGRGTRGRPECVSGMAGQALRHNG